MLTPTSTKVHLRVHHAIFGHADAPDIATLKECVNTGGLDDKTRDIALAVIRGWERQERKRRGTARYLRRFRRIAASLS